MFYSLDALFLTQEGSLNNKSYLKVAFVCSERDLNPHDHIMIIGF